MTDRSISAFLLEGVVTVCESEGISTSDIFAAGGVDVAKVSEPGAKILRSQGVAIINAVSEWSRARSAAFRSGLHIPIQKSPELARLFSSPKDLEQLVAPLNRALGGVCGGLLNISIGPVECRLSLGFPGWNIKEEEAWREAGVGALLCVLRLRFGPQWKPVRLLVGHSRTSATQAVFEGIDVVLGATDNAVVFSNSDASRRPDNGATRRHYERRDHGSTQVGVARMRDQVRMIVAGRLNLSKEILLDDVAEVFEVSTRTVKRRLASEGTNFSQIMEEVRISDAKRLLIETEIPIVEIGQALGYNHMPSFSRAFKRSTGMSPSEIRSSI